MKLVARAARVLQTRGPRTGVDTRWRQFGCVAVAMVLLCPGVVCAALPAAVPVEFWLVEPNEGQSAGGHAAIRIGERVYHVEHRGDGLIADRRTSRALFEEIYRGRGNRRIEAIPLALNAADASALHARLETRFFERSRRLDQLDALETRVRWLDQAIAKGYLSIEIPGLGLYEPGPSSCDGPESTPFADFRRQLDELHGRGWLADRRTAARRETLLWLSRLTEWPEERSTTMSEAGPGGAVRRLRQAAQTWAAFEVLLGCRLVRPDRMQPTSSFEPPVGNLRSRWGRTRDALVVQLHRLVESDRRDLGLPILLTWARRAALERSFATGRLHALDPLAEDDAASGPPQSLEGGLPEHWIPMLRDRAQRTWQRALGDYEAGRGPLEAQLAALERAHHALRHARKSTLHRPTPSQSPSASPAARYVAAEWVLPWPMDLEFSALAAARDVVSTMATTQRHARLVELKYRLFSRNCVTELMAVLDATAAEAPARAARAATAGLVPLASAGFIPVVAARIVEKSMATRPRRRLSSAREEALERARQRARASFFDLRESMTLTSRSYRANPADSSFLFFSDGPVWARPLFGIANLGYALGAATFGFFEAPFDRGEDLRRGIQGVLMSIPELFFFQLRQGTYPVSPPFDLMEQTEGSVSLDPAM